MCQASCHCSTILLPSHAAAGLLTALGLGEDAQLTRKEWSLLRASLGKHLTGYSAC